jgi:hypothetical protein
MPAGSTLDGNSESRPDFVECDVIHSPSSTRGDTDPAPAASEKALPATLDSVAEMVAIEAVGDADGFARGSERGAPSMLTGTLLLDAARSVSDAEVEADVDVVAGGAAASCVSLLSDGRDGNEGAYYSVCVAETGQRRTHMRPHAYTPAHSEAYKE